MSVRAANNHFSMLPFCYCLRDPIIMTLRYSAIHIDFIEHFYGFCGQEDGSCMLKYQCLAILRKGKPQE